MEILYEDSSVIVVIKPQGILSQSDKNGGESLVTRLSEHTGGEIFPVHRLDKETGGVMVYAKTQKAAATLSRDISRHPRNTRRYALRFDFFRQNEKQELCGKAGTKGSKKGRALLRSA